MFKLPQKVIQDIDKFRDSLIKFLNGEIKDTFFRGIRVPWGFYSQRGGKILMSRLRIPAGILTCEQLKAIGEAAEKFANGSLHISTRQDIQIHNVPFENSIKIVEYLKEYNISPRGGGGNTIRNVTCCYLSGVCPYEKIEVYKFVWAITEYLLSLEESYNLPRKFKIAFSGCEKDCAFVGVNDLGLVATDNGFKVLCGGGMGMKSSVGKVLEHNVDTSEVGYVIKAVINVYNKYGDRKNRHHNRLRFFIQDNGWEKFVELYKKELERVKQEEFISLRLSDELPKLKKLENAEPIGCAVEKEYNEFLKFNVGKQKQSGYYYAEIKVPVGEIKAFQLIEISKIKEIIPEAIFRTTQRQNLVVTNIPFNKLYYVYEKIKNVFNNFLYPNSILDIVSCKAATTCNLGICNAIDMAKQIIEELTNLIDTNLIEKFGNFKININGCPNACGQHPIGELGFSGLVRKVYGRSVPFYKVHFGGKVQQENTQLAKELGMLPAKSVPKFLKDLIIEHKQITEEIIKNLLSKYSYLPPYEEDKSYYIDFGKTEEFSLAGISQGECGAGVIDMIESDLNSAKQSLIKSKDNNYDITEIKNALIYSARALLVLKGVDPKDEIETIESFIDKFINTGICSNEYIKIKEIYNGIKNKKIDDVYSLYNYIEKFYEHIKETYQLMDPNFNLPVRFKKEQASSEVSVSDKTIKTVLYDLRGTPCPINYVKAKLKLEELNIDDILEIYLDEGDPINNVPKSLQNDGQEILEIKNVENYYKVLVRKKV